MVLKIDPLRQRIQEVQAFADEHTSHSQGYIQNRQALEKLLNSLHPNQLTLHLVGTKQQVQSLHGLLNANSQLNRSYQITLQVLPHSLQAHNSSAYLVLQSSPVLPQTLRFQLNASPQTVGRNPSVAQLLLPDQFGLVSGKHIEIQQGATGQWQIRDLDSRNGVFINGDSQRLQGWHSLQEGDRIALGSSTGAEGSATLIFGLAESNSGHSTEATMQLPVDCHLLCLVMDAHPFTDFNQQLIQITSNAHIPKLFIILDKGSIATDTLQTNIQTMTTWLARQPHTTPVEIVPLLLQAFAPNQGATLLAPNAQPEYEQFCSVLEDLAQSQSETLIAHHVTTRLLSQIDWIDQELQAQQAVVEQQIQRQEAELQALTPIEMKEQMKKAIKRVNDDRDQSFRQIRGEIAQSKSSILDEFRKNSIPYKIQQYAKLLQSSATNRGGYRYVVLKLENNKSVHAAAIDLCYSLLTEWGEEEWQRVQTNYSDGGLQALLQRSLHTLAFMPNLNFLQTLTQPPVTPSFQQILQLSSAEPDIEARFKQPGPIGYLVKNLKGQVISGVATVALIAQVVNWAIQLTSPPNSQGNNPQADNLKVIITAGILLICLIVMPLSYMQDKEDKTRETADKLRKETTSYYQSFAKGLVDKFTQQLLMAVDLEEKRFREFLETVGEQYTSFAAEFEKQYLQLKTSVEESKKTLQKNRDKNNNDLQKLRKDLGTA